MSGEKTDVTSARPTAKGIAVALVIGCALTLFAAEGVLRLVMPHWREFYSGWFMRVIDVPDHGRVTTGRPGFDGYFAQNNGDFRVRLRVNDFGLRNPEPVEQATDRIWFVGDSMTFGWGVERNDIYDAVAGRLSGTPVYNVASPGANVCGYQALVARMPAAARPRAVIVGLILENDIAQYDCKATAEKSTARPRADRPFSVIAFKRFLTRNTALYNFFAVALKRVGFLREALVSVGLIEKGHAYKRQLSGTAVKKATERTAAELDALRNMLPPGTPFAVMVAPTRFEIRNDDPFSRTLRQIMNAALAGQGIPAIDPFDAFKAAGFGPSHFAHDGHWSSLGHRIAGRAVAEWLQQTTNKTEQ
jgi:lysophospholipase L1-like esterase